MAASPARCAAFDILLRTERDGAHSDTLLHSGHMSGLSRGERAFVTEAVLGCLRRQGEIDHLVGRAARRAPTRIDPEVLVALRIGAYQLRHMRGIPDHAAVSQAVDLVKRARKRSAAGFANAVLRRLPQKPAAGDAVALNHPEWLTRRWATNLGRRRCARLLEANLRKPETYFRIPAPTDVGPILTRLRHAGLEVMATCLPRAYQLTRGNVPSAIAAAGSRLWFRDLNSQRVAALLAGHGSSTVLDVCAAPGGKSRQLAEEAPVVAADRRAARMRMMRRLGRSGIDLVVLNAEISLPFRRTFSRVLVDVPCSGTGTLSRNPEIKWRLRPTDLADLQRRQSRILDNSLNAVAAGGLAVYATCSLEPEENEHVVRAAVSRRPGWTARKAISSVPGSDPGDGFQAWTIRRPAD